MVNNYKKELHKMSSFTKYLEEKKMSRGQLDRTLRASDSKEDVNSLKHEVSEFYTGLAGDVALMKKLFLKAKSKPNLKTPCSPPC